MKLPFKTQEYQTRAVEALTDCFAGQPFSSGIRYQVDPGRDTSLTQLMQRASQSLMMQASRTWRWN